LLSSSFVLCFLCRVRVTDTDFCSLPGNRCHHNATCVTLSTRHACVCNTGFRGDGKHCHGNITRRFCYAQFTPPARHQKTLPDTCVLRRSASGGRTGSAYAARHTPSLYILVERSGRLSSHRHNRHDKTVLSVSCLVCRC